MKTIESRPCVCNRVTSGLYYNVTDCIDCWSYYFDPVWSERWGKPADKKPPHPLLEDLDPDFKKKLEAQFGSPTTPPPAVIPEQEKKFRMSMTCIYLGPVESRADCNCPFKFVHKCDKHGKCVRGPQYIPGTRSCLDCEDFEEDSPFAPER